MNQKIKQRWVKALRSGRYQQAYNDLMSEDSTTGKRTYCCLGVLTQICATTKHKSFDKIAGNTGTLSDVVKQWAGLTHDDPKIRKARLSYRNDTQKQNFSQIAKLIENNL